MLETRKSIYMSMRSSVMSGIFGNIPIPFPRLKRIRENRLEKIVKCH